MVWNMADQHLMAWSDRIHAFVAFADAPARPGEAATGTGRLSGLSVGIKDVINVAGLPTKNGSAACRDAVPAEADATVVARLRAAGAEIVGKTTTTEFAYTDPTDCRNPHDLNRSPGGSSSGSGAAVGAGIVDIALGTQTAGSLCRPAAYCGVTGFKPSYGSLPRDGVTSLATSFDTVGIIARTVALARTAFSIMAETEPDGEQSEGMAKTALVGLFDTDLVPTEETMDALHAGAAAMREIVPGVRDGIVQADVQKIVSSHRLVMDFEAAEAHANLLSEDRLALLRPNFRAAITAGAATDADDVTAARQFLAQARETFWSGLAGTDVILTLAVPDGAPLIDGTTGFQNWLTPWTVFGGPLLCLPWGVDPLGRPRSIMLAGRPGSDYEILNLGEKMEACAPPIPQPKLP